MLLDAFREQNGGLLADYSVSHAGQESFPRSFQMLAEGGTITFYGATSGYWFSFVGKRGGSTPDSMLRRARLRAGCRRCGTCALGSPQAFWRTQS